MKSFFFLSLATLLFVTSCSMDDELSGSERIISDDTTVQFEEILLLINIRNTDSSYIAVEQIDSITLYLNNLYWATLNSESIKLESITTELKNNFYCTPNKINYLVVASQKEYEPDFSTAGDYARYLNSFYDIESGEYLCLIESLWLKQADGSVRKIFPYKYVPFQVENDLKSVFLGEVEINL